MIDLLTVIGIGVLAILIFFMPMSIAHTKQMKGRWIIYVMNPFVAWTGIGWLILLYIAIVAEDRNV